MNFLIGAARSPRIVRTATAAVITVIAMAAALADCSPPSRPNAGSSPGGASPLTTIPCPARARDAEALGAQDVGFTSFEVEVREQAEPWPPGAYSQTIDVFARLAPGYRVADVPALLAWLVHLTDCVGQAEGATQVPFVDLTSAQPLGLDWKAAKQDLDGDWPGLSGDVDVPSPTSCDGRPCYFSSSISLWGSGPQLILDAVGTQPLGPLPAGVLLATPVTAPTVTS